MQSRSVQEFIASWAAANREPGMVAMPHATMKHWHDLGFPRSNGALDMLFRWIGEADDHAVVRTTVSDMRQVQLRTVTAKTVQNRLDRLTEMGLIAVHPFIAGEDARTISLEGFFAKCLEVEDVCAEGCRFWKGGDIKQNIYGMCCLMPNRSCRRCTAAGIVYTEDGPCGCGRPFGHRTERGDDPFCIERDRTRPTQR